MERLLIAGVDTVVGANLAATLADRYQVSTWCAEPGYEIAQCRALDPDLDLAAAFSVARPNWVVYCGPAARSTWEPGCQAALTDDCVFEARHWAQAAREAGCRFTMVSSDALFTGPWMFHDEDSRSVCSSFPAQIIRAAELQVQEVYPQALIIRTNAFGWSANPDGQGWLESLLDGISRKRVVDQDYIRHATPILASDLAEVLHRAEQENLTGVFHVAGAERISPLKFAQRLADEFDLPWLAMRREASVNEPPAGFGEGECSLQTKNIRKALCVAMPLLSEGLDRLRRQVESGYREQLRPQSRPLPQRRVA